MKKFHLLLPFLILILTGCINNEVDRLSDIKQPELVAKSKDNQFWPLAAGNYWIYQGVVAELETGLSEVKQKEQITEVIEKNNTTIAIVKVEKMVKNFARNAKEEWRVYYYAIINQGNKYYSKSDIEDSQDILKKNIKIDDDYFFKFELPLTSGKSWDCADERNDKFYCWIITGIEPDGSYIFEYSETSGHSRYTLKEGLGVTKFKYHHNGSLDDEILYLVDYKIN